jgi:hypothetical protein
LASSGRPVVVRARAAPSPKATSNDPPPRARSAQRRVDGIWSAAALAEEARHRILRLEAAPLPPGARAAVVGAAAALVTVPTVLLLAPGLADLLG